MGTKDEELESILNAHRTIIRVVGTGGGGNNTITRLTEVNIEGIETVAINTDAQDLLFTKAEHKLLIGKNISSGLGAGSNPDIGAESARENEEEIKNLLEGSDMVFITCGLGGGTGTGSAPVVAEIAKQINALTIAVVTIPFAEEGVLRRENAIKGLDQLRENSDTVIVVQNDKLLDMVPDLPLNAAFKVADEILVNAVKGITELVTEKGLVNLDFADVKSIMKNGDTAMIGIGESESDTKASDAVEKAIDNPLLDVDITGAQSALINITGDETMSMREARSVMVSIAEKLDPNAKIIWGARIDEEMKGKIRVLLIATGIKTGTQDGLPVSQADNIKTEEPPIKTVKANPFFDIKEAGSLGTIPSPNPPVNQHVNKPQTKNSSPKVFNQMFEEEIQGDINVLRESILNLEVGKADEKIFKNIKNACKALQNSAQLFSNKKIEEFTIFIEEVFEEMLTRKIGITERFLQTIKNIPMILEGMLTNSKNALSKAQEIIEAVTSIIDEQNNRNNSKNRFGAIKNIPESPNIIKDELKIEQEDLRSKLRMDLN